MKIVNSATLFAVGHKKTYSKITISVVVNFKFLSHNLKHLSYSEINTCTIRFPPTLITYEIISPSIVADVIYSLYLF